ncbi:hypothetical protein MKW98_024390 [Papaver atlanticum]|uniref:Uncharacterized protein n=1 Tax=Papaver atlanticum TaxID=357466 RepID=A0AAD4XN83_9MAGN|nr:hypothetical protein MKW98_024390 [Papaver atlanticum]
MFSRSIDLPRFFFAPRLTSGNSTRGIQYLGFRYNQSEKNENKTYLSFCGLPLAAETMRRTWTVLCFGFRRHKLPSVASTIGWKGLELFNLIAKELTRLLH